LVARLKSHPEVSERRALILALGEFPEDRLPASERQALTPLLLKQYRDDPDPGIHGAVRWLLTQRWGLGADLERIDQGLASQGPSTSRDWYVNKEGQTFSVIRGPVEFLMGSTPETDPERDVGEVQHPRRIDRTFAVATTEVTVAQYARFLKENPGVLNLLENTQFKEEHPSAACAISAVDWYDAARYCNWLSARECIPEDQWCYPKAIGPGMELPANYLQRTGYRVPTETEWEYACRAGTATPRPHGCSEGMLVEYGWYMANSGRQVRPVGTLKPNDLGLFDPLGNVWEWGMDPYDTYEKFHTGNNKTNNGATTDEGILVGSIEGVVRVIRGGGYYASAASLRSSVRYANQPFHRSGDGGLRLARTCPGPPAGRPGG
jgi:formylglycine-generating enzyme required for sulfatase activity